MADIRLAFEDRSQALIRVYWPREISAIIDNLDSHKKAAGMRTKYASGWIQTNETTQFKCGIHGSLYKPLSVLDGSCIWTQDGYHYCVIAFLWKTLNKVNNLFRNLFIKVILVLDTNFNSTAGSHLKLMNNTTQGQESHLLVKMSWNGGMRVMSIWGVDGLAQAVSGMIQMCNSKYYAVWMQNYSNVILRFICSVHKSAFLTEAVQCHTPSRKRYN